MIKPLFMRNVFEPLYSKLYRRDERLRHYSFLKKAQWNSLEKNLELQKDVLYRMLDYAVRDIPYYRRMGVKVSRESVEEDLRRFPLLDKDAIRNNLKELSSTTGLRWYYNTSGGSTGKPVRFIQDFGYEAWSCAMSRVQEEWAYYRLGEPQVRLWGSEKDIFQQKEGLQHRFASWMRSVYLMNSFLMDDRRMREYTKRINKLKPVMILSYAQSVYELARFISKNGLKVHSPKSIMASAGVLHTGMKEEIEKVFRCPVFNRYGSREVGPVACDCERHEGLHLSIFNHYIEILDKDCNPCRDGESGDIYVTTLTNFSMPLIRYRIGDRAVQTTRRCSCGRGLPMIAGLKGRDVDMFITKDGKLVDGEYFTHLFYFMDHIEQFQVVQRAADDILIKVKTADKDAFRRELDEIKRKIELVMGKCKVDYRFMRRIPPLKSGKFSYTIREFDNE